MELMHVQTGIELDLINLPEDIRVGLEKQGNFEVIEVNIVLPEMR